MNILKQEKEIVNHLIDVCKDGLDFYRAASELVGDHDIRHLFRKNANIRESIILNLETYMKQKGIVVETAGTIEGKTRKLFGGLIAFVSSDKDKKYVDQLEEAEDRSLEEFHKALAKETSQELRERIVGFVNDLQKTHDQMRAMKNIMKAA